MNDDIFVHIFSGLDEEFVGEANEAMNFWLESQEGEVVRADGSRRFPWRTVIASVACTAAALFGVFVLMLNVGKIGIIDTTESSANSPAQSGVTPDLPTDAVLFEEAAYAYEDDSTVLKRYEVGDKFGENTTITSAKATYKSLDSKVVLQKQEIILAPNTILTPNNVIKDDVFESGIISYIIEGLGFPSFGDGFEIEPHIQYVTVENSQVSYPIITDLEIFVDYEAKTVQLYTTVNRS